MELILGSLEGCRYTHQILCRKQIPSFACLGHLWVTYREARYIFPMLDKVFLLSLTQTCIYFLGLWQVWWVDKTFV